MNSGKINQQFGLSHLTNSIFSALNVADTTDYLELKQANMRECLILIDGMGQDAVNKYGDQFPIFEELKNMRTIYTNFPSTTATSLSTLGTGVLPGVHGMLGYTVRVPRSDNRLLNALKWDERVDPVMWQKVPTLFEAKQRCFWFIDGLGKHGLTVELFSQMSTETICELYNVDINYFRLNTNDYE